MYNVSKYANSCPLVIITYLGNQANNFIITLQLSHHVKFYEFRVLVRIKNYHVLERICAQNRLFYTMTSVSAC